jgi:serine/threonine-protein kinase
VNHRFLRSLADRYRIERSSGAVEWPTVYLGLEHIAIPPQASASEGAASRALARESAPERFLKESSSRQVSSNPHILPLFDSGDADRQPRTYAAMPFRRTGRDVCARGSSS